MVESSNWEEGLTIVESSFSAPALFFSLGGSFLASV
jgi:hypothetical protein